MVGIDALKETIQKVAESRFADKISYVTVARERDFEGEGILAITIVTNLTDKGGLNAKLASGFTRHLRTELDKIGEQDFPVISFVPKSDMKNREPEAA